MKRPAAFISFSCFLRFGTKDSAFLHESGNYEGSLFLSIVSARFSGVFLLRTMVNFPVFRYYVRFDKLVIVIPSVFLIQALRTSKPKLSAICHHSISLDQATGAGSASSENSAAVMPPASRITMRSAGAKTIPRRLRSYQSLFPVEPLLPPDKSILHPFEE